jgi:hypothetical membrane protein
MKKKTSVNNQSTATVQERYTTDSAISADSTTIGNRQLGHGPGIVLVQGATLAPRWLALGAVAGPVLGTLVWIVLGFLRPGYSPISQPVSALGIGPNGAFMNAAFMFDGLLCSVAVIAVFQGLKNELGAAARWTCTALLLLSPCGLLWIGIFTMNTLALHLLGAQLAFAAPIIALPVAGFVLRRVPSWRRLGTWMIVIGGPLTLALLIGFIASVPVSERVTGGGSYGLWERALASEVLGWYVAIGWLAFRRSHESIDVPIQEGSPE